MPAALFALAVLVRVVVAVRTCIPARDADAYLWMAERVAAGDLGAAFRTVFHPLYPVLTAVPLALFDGLDPVVAGQITSCGLGALAVFPLYRIAERLGGRRAAIATGLFYALGVWFARYPADCMSEGPFFLVVAWWGRIMIERRTGAPLAVAGGLAGLAYALRPEGAALLILGVSHLALARGSERRRAAATYAVGFLAAAIWWPLGWGAFGDGLTLTPKAAFSWADGVGGADSPLRHYGANLLSVPFAMFDALGYGVVPLAAYGLWLKRPHRVGDPIALLVAVFCLQCLVVPLLRSNIRFLAGFGILLLPLAGVGAAAVWERVRARPLLAAGLALACFAGDLVRIPQARRTDRIVLRELGDHLRPTLSRGETVATDMPRLAYFLGQPPNPPRRIERDEILAWCADPSTRYAIVVEPRSQVGADDLRGLGFRPVVLPERLRALAAARHMLVFER